VINLWQHSLGEIEKVSAVSKTFDPIKYIEFDSREEFEKSRKNLPKFRQTRSLKVLDNTFAIEDKQFIDAIFERRDVEVDGWIGYKAMAIPMAVYELAAIGKPVKVEDILELKIEKYQGELNKLRGV